MDRHAFLSSCGQYRYRLRRSWGDGPTCLWIGLNPSTADGYTDDRTIRRIVAFSRAWGYGAATVVNLYAYRATEPVVMFRATDPEGPDNMHWIHHEARHPQTRRIVAAWGEKAHRTAQAFKTLQTLKEAGVEIVYCLGRTKEGGPRHPLYVRKAQLPEPFWTRADQQRLMPSQPDNVQQLPRRD